MALNAKALLEMLPDLERFLAVKASEDFEAGMGEAEEEDDDMPESMGAASPVTSPEAKPPGMGVVIALKPKGGGEKVPGCPDCADGTPHEHAGK